MDQIRRGNTEHYILQYYSKMEIKGDLKGLFYSLYSELHINKSKDTAEINIVILTSAWKPSTKMATSKLKST